MVPKLTAGTKINEGESVGIIKHVISTCSLTDDSSIGDKEFSLSTITRSCFSSTESLDCKHTCGCIEETSDSPRSIQKNSTIDNEAISCDDANTSFPSVSAKKTTLSDQK